MREGGSFHAAAYARGYMGLELQAESVLAGLCAAACLKADWPFYASWLAFRLIVAK